MRKSAKTKKLKAMNESNTLAVLGKVVADTLHYFNEINRPSRRPVHQPWLTADSDVISEERSHENDGSNDDEDDIHSARQRRHQHSVSESECEATSQAKGPISQPSPAQPSSVHTNSDHSTVPPLLTPISLREPSEHNATGESDTPLKPSITSPAQSEIPFLSPSTTPGVHSTTPSTLQTPTKKGHKRSVSRIVGDDRFNPNINSFVRIRYALW